MPCSHDGHRLLPRNPCRNSAAAAFSPQRLRPPVRRDRERPRCWQMRPSSTEQRRERFRPPDEGAERSRDSAGVRSPQRRPQTRGSDASRGSTRQERSPAQLLGSGEGSILDFLHDAKIDAKTCRFPFGIPFSDAKYQTRLDELNSPATSKLFDSTSSVSRRSNDQWFFQYCRLQLPRQSMMINQGAMFVKKKTKM
mmetsp:Transcript_9098/g.22266  ORF Transcript_9098/g.22266 Transcript_9098/m.22266 type:complete len:196 (-) Transcript_9098:38-625(-)